MDCVLRIWVTRRRGAKRGAPEANINGTCERGRGGKRKERKKKTGIIINEKERKGKKGVCMNDKGERSCK
jgi:hypothetical protein